MLKISKLADYGVILMCALAAEHQTQPGGLKSARALADAVNIPETTVSKLLKLMVKAHLARSVRGADGGYVLAQSAETISLRQMIAAVEHAPALTACCAEIDLCTQSRLCSVKDNWQMINQVVLSVLDRVTLAEMTHPLTHDKMIQLAETPTCLNRKKIKA